MDPLTGMQLASLGVKAIQGIFGGFSARKQARDLENKQRQYERKVASLEASRQEVINPYENVSDLSSMLTNPFANLQVATKAAEMQAAETDISLASTLDTLRATGAGAGGATALAQAAARSKQGISASIEQQEAKNAELRAQGQQQLQAARMDEAKRIQQADVAGKSFMFNVTEQRQLMELDRAQSMAEQYMAGAVQSRNRSAAAFGEGLGSLAAFGVGGGFNKESWS